MKKVKRCIVIIIIIVLTTSCTIVPKEKSAAEKNFTERITPTPTSKPTPKPKPTTSPKPTSTPKPTPTPKPTSAPVPKPTIVLEKWDEKDYSNPNTIKMVQSILNLSGYNCGAIDGICGKKTQSAIRQYQAAMNLEQNGSITKSLLDSMQLDEKYRYAVTIEEFVSRYNYAVEYLNTIGADAGKSLVSGISIETVLGDSFDSEGMDLIEFHLDAQHIAVLSISLKNEEHSYEMQSVYELVACAYALDNSLNDISNAMEIVLQFAESEIATTEQVIYSMENDSGEISISLN